jgi:hypothetical protein
VTRRLARWFVFVFLVSTPAYAQDTDSKVEAEADPATLFAEAHAALVADHPADAIIKLEALSDRGVVDPVASFDRGLAYAARVRAGAGQPGDLGRAAHAFEEARELTRDSALANDAARALAQVRAEIARRRARAGDPIEIQTGVSAGRSIVRLLPENVWAILAGIAAIALSLGIVLRSIAKASRAKVAGSTTCGIAGALLVIFALLGWAARDARRTLREGIIVVSGAAVLDQNHLVQSGVAPIPEGSRVQLLSESAGYTEISAGGVQGWLPANAVVPLAKR